MILAAAAVRAGLVRVIHGGSWLDSRSDVRLQNVFSGPRDFRAAAFRTREELWSCPVSVDTLVRPRVLVMRAVARG